MTDTAFEAEQFNGFYDVFEIVRRLAHAHEHDFFYRTQRSRQNHLSNNFSAAQLAQQAITAGHAEYAADGTTNLR